ncbi:hypothetical protein IWZ01DRAFT_486107 [Phyllosticta capitalensis]
MDPENGEPTRRRAQRARPVHFTDLEACAFLPTFEVAHRGRKGRRQAMLGRASSRQASSQTKAALTSQPSESFQLRRSSQPRTICQAHPLLTVVIFSSPLSVHVSTCNTTPPASPSQETPIAQSWQPTATPHSTASDLFDSCTIGKRLAAQTSIWGIGVPRKSPVLQMKQAIHRYHAPKSTPIRLARESVSTNVYEIPTVFSSPTTTSSAIKAEDPGEQLQRAAMPRTGLAVGVGEYIWEASGHGS